MVKCLACDDESPDGSLHCVHCGSKIGASPQATSFGLPAVRPQGARIGDPGTQVLGRDNAEPMATPMPLTGGIADSPAPGQSLLAGLPRPRVSSAPSPLTEGLRKRDSVRRAQSPSARSTVMGMPIFAAPVPQSSAQSGAPGAQGGAIQSLDSAADATPRGAGIQSLDSYGRVSPANAGTPASLQADPTPLVQAPQARQAPVNTGSGLADTPPPGPDETPAPATAPLRGEPKVEIKPKPVVNAPAPRAPSPRPKPQEDAQAPGGSRGLAAVIGLVLVGLFTYPLGRDWFFNVIGQYTGTAQLAFAGVGVAGALALLTALLPMGHRTRALTAVVFGAAGLACLAFI